MTRLTFHTACLVALACWPAVSAAGELKPGDAAPNFTLHASDGKVYTLADFTGRRAVVLAWFPKAYTHACTLECKSLAEHGDLIRKYDVQYFMVSVDDLVYNKGFAEQQRADFPLLSDSTKKTAEVYGVLGMLGLAKRWTFYIGKDGKIDAIDKQVRPATAAEDISARLRDLGIPAR